VGVGIIGVAVAYFSVTNEKFRNFLVQRSIDKVPSAFVALAREYRLADSLPDDPPGPIERQPWESRVSKKNVLAEGLGRFAQGARFDRKILVAANDDGYIVALTKLIAAEPRSGDASFLAQAAKRRVPPHADYQTLAAIGVLADKGIISVQERASLDDALDRMSNRLGADHNDEIRRVRAKLRSSAG
jgi:hypothetical protein